MKIIKGASLSWWGIREDNKIKYTKCNICGFQKEDTRFTDRSLCGQTFKEMEEHVISDHKEAFDDEVIGWQGGFIDWSNWSMYYKHIVIIHCWLVV